MLLQAVRGVLGSGLETVQNIVAQGVEGLGRCEADDERNAWRTLKNCNNDSQHSATRSMKPCCCLKVKLR